MPISQWRRGFRARRLSCRAIGLADVQAIALSLSGCEPTARMNVVPHADRQS